MDAIDIAESIYIYIQVYNIYTNAYKLLNEQISINKTITGKPSSITIYLLKRIQNQYEIRLKLLANS